mmetsp:Transcript_1299/g.2839  ORF Transcript_1299/g.2839 Transcript_1299/m.2839 type:complete len:239 (-) Transcript_1299:18-734(-)
MTAVALPLRCLSLDQFFRPTRSFFVFRLGFRLGVRLRIGLDSFGAGLFDFRLSLSFLDILHRSTNGFLECGIDFFHVRFVMGRSVRVVVRRRRKVRWRSARWKVRRPMRRRRKVRRPMGWSMRRKRRRKCTGSKATRSKGSSSTATVLAEMRAASGAKLGVAAMPAILHGTVALQFRFFKLDFFTFVVFHTVGTKIVILHIHCVESLAHNRRGEASITRVSSVDKITFPFLRGGIFRR